MNKPTSELYNAIQIAYEHFNNELFTGVLPPVIFTTQRQHKVMGYFAPDRWAAADGNKCHEIAINPLYVGRSSLIEFMSTLAHEMVHCWQQCFGKPSARTYHNREWSQVMRDIGLMPSSTGKQGGKDYGQKMGQFPVVGGKFILACQSLLENKKFNMPWVDRLSVASKPAESDDSEVVIDESSEYALALADLDSSIVAQLTSTLDSLYGAENFIESDDEEKKKYKSKYTCPNCQVNVWGKNELALICGACKIEFIKVSL